MADVPSSAFAGGLTAGIIGGAGVETVRAGFKIGSSVWIGMNSLVLKGAVIGDNTIIAAGSTVTGEIPANCIAAGNPAIPIKYFTSS